MSEVSLSVLAEASEEEVELRQQKGNAFTRYCHRFWRRDRLRRLLPPLAWIPKYNAKCFFGDIIAGLSVGLTLVPQSLANAKIAHLPLQYGLYSAFMGPFIYSILGTSKDAAVGPTAIVSLIVAGYSRDPMRSPGYAALIAFCSGVILIAMFLLNLGFVVQFIPLPVISAFTSAGAILIINAQIRSWLGLTGVRPDFFDSVYDTFSKLPETRKWDATLGVVCMAFLVAIKQLKERLVDPRERAAPSSRLRRVLLRVAGVACTARNAAVVLLSAAVAATLGAGDGGAGDGSGGAFIQTHSVPHGLPAFRPPTLPVAMSVGNQTVYQEPVAVFKEVGVGLLVVSFVCALEQIAVTKTLARKNGYRVDTTQELLAIGASNVLGSLFGSFPVTGSMSRSAIASSSGMATPAGGIVSGAVSLLALAFLTPYFVYIPQAALAAVVIVAAADVIDVMILRSLWISRRFELIPYVVTFVLCLPWGIEYGIMAGTALNIVMALYPMSRPALSVRQTRSPGANGLQEPDDLALAAGSKAPITLIQLNPGLLFPGSEYIYDKVMKYGPLQTPPCSVLLDCVHCSDLDFTAIQALRALSHQFKSRSQRLVMVNLKVCLRDTLIKANLENVDIAKDISDGKNLLRNAAAGASEMVIQDLKFPSASENVNAGYSNAAFEEGASSFRSLR